jgi:hypothetical protein
MGVVYNSGFTGDRGQGKGPSTAEIFRNNLYKFGKFAGTAKVTPGLAGSSIANTLNRQRNLAYPIARWIGNFDTFSKRGQIGAGGFLARGIARGGRIVSGSVSGRLINVAARPLGQFGLGAQFGPLAARGFRIMLGKQLMKNNPINNMVNSITSKVTASAKVNGKAINWKIRKDKNIQREAQKVLLMAHSNILAMAPDVSSGQYHVGGPRKKDAQMLNKDLMMDVKNFNQLGIAYREDGKKIFRDIFGFSQPGQARSFLLGSVNMNNMRATKGTKVDHFFRGSIKVGGSERGFPWIWAVEYGGNIPVYYPAKVKGKHALNRNELGNPINAKFLKEMDNVSKKKAMEEYDIVKGRKKSNQEYYIPENEFIQPTFFIHRAAQRAAEKASKMTTMQQAKLTSPGSKYYADWLKLAKRDMEKLKAKKMGYADKFVKKAAIKSAFRENYQLERGQGANFMSFMEQKIPGPRTELAHGNFYSKDVADAIGVKLVPEDMQYSFAFRTRQQDTAPVLKKAAEIYVRRGGNVKRAYEGRNIDTFHKQASKRDPVSNEIAKAIGKMPGRSRFSDEDNYEDARRYVNLFKNYNIAQGNVSNMQRRKEYLDKVYDFSVSFTPGGRKATVKLRKKRGTVGGNKNRQIERQKQEKLANDIFTQLDIEELMKEIGGS